MENGEPRSLSAEPLRPHRELALRQPSRGHQLRPSRTECSSYSLLRPLAHPFPFSVHCKQAVRVEADPHSPSRPELLNGAREPHSIWTGTPPTVNAQGPRRDQGQNPQRRTLWVQSNRGQRRSSTPGGELWRTLPPSQEATDQSTPSPSPS